MNTTTFSRFASPLLLLGGLCLTGCPKENWPAPESTTPKPRTFAQPAEPNSSADKTSTDAQPADSPKGEKPEKPANPVTLDNLLDTPLDTPPVAPTATDKPAPQPSPQPSPQPTAAPKPKEVEATGQETKPDEKESAPATAATPSPFAIPRGQTPVSPAFPSPPTPSPPPVEPKPVDPQVPEPKPVDPQVPEPKPVDPKVPEPKPVDQNLSSGWTAPGVVPKNTEPEAVRSGENEIGRTVRANGFPKQAEKQGEGYDPIAENGEYFVDWPDPKAVIVLTGNMNGYVEPCGCAGIARMKGGLSRRHSFFKELESKKWPAFAIDAGNLIKGFGRQEEIKFEFVINESLRLMNYQAAGIGPKELLFPTETLVVYTVDAPGNPKRFTSANVALFQFNPTNTAPYRVLKQGALSVAVTSVLCNSQQGNIHNDDLQLADPLAKLREIQPKIEAEKCDYRVLIVHGDAAEAEALNKALPKQYDFLVLSDTPAEPPHTPLLFPDGAYRIEVGEKGKFAVVLGLFDDPQKPVRYQRVAFDSRYKNSPEVVAAMQCYQDTLQMIGFSDLGIKPVPDPLAPIQGKYVGSEKCADCHEPSMRVWKKSGHAKAWASIQEHSTPSRDYDPECISCHVIGWNAQEFFPYESGFLGEKETPHLRNVGCESCHGPGEEHVLAEMGADKERQAKQRAAARLPLADAKKMCITCHDGDNSPDFNFDTYWPKIEHKEGE